MIHREYAIVLSITTSREVAPAKLDAAVRAVVRNTAAEAIETGLSEAGLRSQPRYLVSVGLAEAQPVEWDR